MHKSLQKYVLAVSCYRSLVFFLLIYENSVTEYGNTFGVLVPLSKNDIKVQKIVQFCQRYAKKRHPWSLPNHKLKLVQPQILTLEMKRLLYSYDNVQPLIFDEQVLDRDGNVHGVSQLIPLGYLFRMLLLWKQEALKFTHNFTLSVYANDELNVYSHSFVIQKVNSTMKSNYLLPKFNVHTQKLDSNNAHVWEHGENIDLMYTDPNEADDLETSVDSLYTEHEQPKFIEESDLYGRYNYSRYTDKQFSVMSYNIWNMNSLLKVKGGYTRRMQKLQKVILEVNPDIVGLQEVRYESGKGEQLGPSQMDTLADWFPEYQFVFQPAQMQPNTLNDGRAEEGVAIMSRYPIISSDVTMLFINRSNSADLHQRVLLHAQIYIPKLGKVHVFVTHLSLSHEAREQSVVQICDIMKQKQGPVILLGDLNAEPDELAVRYLTGQASLPHGEPCKLHDVWRENNQPEVKGNTFNTLDKHLTKRIDYIFFNEETLCCHPDISYVLDDGARRKEAASDHLPLVATFTFHCPVSRD